VLPMAQAMYDLPTPGRIPYCQGIFHPPIPVISTQIALDNHYYLIVTC